MTNKGRQNKYTKEQFLGLSLSTLLGIAAIVSGLGSLHGDTNQGEQSDSSTGQTEGNVA